MERTHGPWLISLTTTTYSSYRHHCFCLFCVHAIASLADPAPVCRTVVCFVSSSSRLHPFLSHGPSRRTDTHMHGRSLAHGHHTRSYSHSFLFLFARCTWPSYGTFFALRTHPVGSSCMERRRLRMLFTAHRQASARSRPRCHAWNAIDRPRPLFVLVASMRRCCRCRVSCLVRLVDVGVSRPPSSPVPVIRPLDKATPSLSTCRAARPRVLMIWAVCGYAIDRVECPEHACVCLGAIPRGLIMLCVLHFIVTCDLPLLVLFYFYLCRMGSIYLVLLPVSVSDDLRR